MTELGIFYTDVEYLNSMISKDVKVKSANKI